MTEATKCAAGSWAEPAPEQGPGGFPPTTTTKTCTAHPGRGNREDNRSHVQAPLHMSVHLIPILQMRKVELREVEHLGQSHTALNLQD